MSLEDRIATSHVSHHWRDASLSSPGRLWSAIPALASPDMLQALLERSGGSAVDIERIDVRGDTLDYISDLLENHMYHIRSLAIQLRWVATRSRNGYIALQRALGCPAPVLERFELVDIDASLVPRPTAHIFAGQAPRLVSLVLHGVCADLRPVSSLLSVQELHLCPELELAKRELVPHDYTPIEFLLGTIPTIWPHLRRLRLDTPAHATFQHDQDAPILHLPHLDDLTLQSATEFAAVHLMIHAFAHEVIRTVSLWPYGGIGNRGETEYLMATAQGVDRNTRQPTIPAFHVDLDVLPYGQSEVRIIDLEHRRRLYHVQIRAAFTHLQSYAFHRITSLTLCGLSILASGAVPSLLKLTLPLLTDLRLILNENYPLHICLERAEELPQLRTPALRNLVFVHNRSEEADVEPALPEPSSPDDDVEELELEEPIPRPPAPELLAKFIGRKIRLPPAQGNLGSRPRSLVRLELRGVNLGPDTTRAPLRALCEVLEEVPWDDVDDAEVVFPFDGTVPGWAAGAGALWT